MSPGLFGLRFGLGRGFRHTDIPAQFRKGHPAAMDRGDGGHIQTQPLDVFIEIDVVRVRRGRRRRIGRHRRPGIRFGEDLLVGEIDHQETVGMAAALEGIDLDRTLAVGEDELVGDGFEHGRLASGFRVRGLAQAAS